MCFMLRLPRSVGQTTFCHVVLHGCRSDFFAVKSIKSETSTTENNVNLSNERRGGTYQTSPSKQSIGSTHGGTPTRECVLTNVLTCVLTPSEWKRRAELTGLNRKTPSKHRNDQAQNQKAPNARHVIASIFASRQTTTKDDKTATQQQRNGNET